MTITSFKVAHTSFLARGVDHHRASRARNMSDGGARFFYQNKYMYGGARLFLPKVTFVLLETKFAYTGGFTCWNNLSQFCVFKKNCFGNPMFPKCHRKLNRLCSHQERIKDS